MGKQSIALSRGVHRTKLQFRCGTHRPRHRTPLPTPSSSLGPPTTRSVSLMSPLHPAPLLLCWVHPAVSRGSRWGTVSLLLSLTLQAFQPLCRARSHGRSSSTLSCSRPCAAPLFCIYFSSASTSRMLLRSTFSVLLNRRSEYPRYTHQSPEVHRAPTARFGKEHADLGYLPSQGYHARSIPKSRVPHLHARIGISESDEAKEGLGTAPARSRVCSDPQRSLLMAAPFHVSWRRSVGVGRSIVSPNPSCP